MQILFPLCVPQTGLPCLPPTNPNCHHESRKKHTLSLENSTNWLTYFFHTRQHDFKMLKKTRAKVNSLSAPPPPLTPHAHELLNLGNQTRERGGKNEKEKAQPSIASHRIYIEFTSQTQGAPSEVPWAKFVLCLNLNFCLPR